MIKCCYLQVREKIMSPFKKVKNFDSTANVLSYAYFQVWTVAISQRTISTPDFCRPLNAFPIFRLSSSQTPWMSISNVWYRSAYYNTCHGSAFLIHATGYSSINFKCLAMLNTHMTCLTFSCMYWNICTLSSYTWLSKYTFQFSFLLYFHMSNFQVCRSSCPEPQCGGQAPPANVNNVGQCKISGSQQY